LRATFASPLNPYQASIFERTQRPAFSIGLDAPVLHHQVGNNKGVSLSQSFNVPEGQPDQ
jgi:hypothetical protein